MDWVQELPSHPLEGERTRATTTTAMRTTTTMTTDQEADMDRSVSAACSAASEAVARTLLAVNRFVREVRESRSEFDGIATELHSLDGVLDLLGYDAAFIPPPLAEHTPAVLATCLALLDELEGCISLLNRPDVPRPEKRSRWLASRKHVETLRWTLGEYKLVLGLAADLVGVTKSRVTDSASRGRPDDEHARCGDEAEEDGLAIVTARIVEVSNELKGELEQSVAMARLGRYLEMLRAATGIGPPSPVPPPRDSRRQHRTSSMGGAPDSAIDRPTPTTSFLADPWEEEEEEEEEEDEDRDEFVGELSEMPARAPPVPPRSASRVRSAVPSRPSAQHRPGAVDNYCDPRSSPSPSWPSTPRMSTSSSSDVSHRTSQEPYYTPVTVTEPPERAVASPRFRSDPKPTHSRRGSTLSQVLESVWEHPQRDASPAGARSETTPSRRHSGLFRRRSAKLPSPFRLFGRKWSSSAKGDAAAAAAHGEAQVPGAVFGVPLANSIQVARGVAGTRHRAGGTSSSSSSYATRDYPLCVLRCVYHIRDCGLHVPHVFGGLEDPGRLAELKAIFGAPETGYGKELDWSRFTVHEAAALILVFLSELPRPLVPESVAKRWVALSRQAAVGSVRLDQGLDFWEEALLGVQGHARSLFKLLLNLWGDLADAAPVNEMTAERLAARVIRPLMHEIPARHHTDFMLGLAFVIRKRSEYSLAANGVARQSNAAF
ncbi:hypothetical protein VTH06DRAFT_2388 [Thermothelomyces fergusii]